MQKYHISALAALAATLVISAAGDADADAGNCRDPWVTQAVREVTGRAPNGDYESGECRYTNYGGGQWSSYPDLLNKVRAVLGQKYSIQPAGTISVQSLRNAPTGIAGGTTWYWINDKWFRIVSTGGGSYNLISQDGASLVASGGGN